MNARVLDAKALAVVTPAGLTAYVRSEGWRKIEEFGDHSDVYARSKSPELIIPGTDALGDYPAVVWSTIEILARTEGRNELQVYRDLVSADRDVIRVRAPAASA